MLITKPLIAIALAAASTATGIAISHSSQSGHVLARAHAQTTAAHARRSLLTLEDLPIGWRTAAASNTHSDIALHPDTCAAATASLATTSTAWSSAPVDERVAFTADTGTTTLSEEITDDPRRDPDQLVSALHALITSCRTFTFTTEEGMTYAGTVRTTDFGRNNGIALTQTWTGPAGTLTAYYAYLINGHTITTLAATTNGGLTTASFAAIDDTAAAKL